MAGAVSHLHGQIVHDLENLNPVIIAETNYWSEAHRVGFAARMEVPPRKVLGGHVSQVLMQNVRVGDGKMPDGLRDFTMMYLPPNAQRNQYDPASRAAILREGDI